MLNRRVLKDVYRNQRAAALSAIQQNNIGIAALHVSTLVYMTHEVEYPIASSYTDLIRIMN